MGAHEPFYLTFDLFHLVLLATMMESVVVCNFEGKS